MLQSIKQLYGNKLGASDGEVGHIKDCYFSDQNWAVRYVIADTGSWLTGRQVLIAPHAFGGLHQAGKVLAVNLTRKQIEDSPSIDTHKPVSRQYEQEYYRYYGWPYYWEGDGLWGGMRGFPVLEPPASAPPTGHAAPLDKNLTQADLHLRSTQAVNGYHIKAGDVMTGHVCDFLMDRQSWAIRQLVVKIGHRFTGKEIVIPVNAVERISYDESTVFVKMTKEAVENSPAFDEAPVRVGGFKPPEHNHQTHEAAASSK